MHPPLDAATADDDRALPPDVFSRHITPHHTRDTTVAHGMRTARWKLQRYGTSQPRHKDRRHSTAAQPRTAPRATDAQTHLSDKGAQVIHQRRALRVGSGPCTTCARLLRHGYPTGVL